MEEIARWVAPVSTTIAACMTAANLGPRFTGWGFVVFTVGAVAWAAVGMATGQANLVWQNAILLVIDLIGVWRWLGREARYDEGARRAVRAAERKGQALVPTSRLTGCPVTGPGGVVVATTVDAMLSVDGGRVQRVIVREGGVAGIGERLHALGWDEIASGADGFTTALDAEALRARRPLDPSDWRRAAGKA